MEALLKLIVGVDGVTATMLVQVAWAYVALKIGSMLTFLGGASVAGYTIYKSIVYCQDADVRRDKNRDEAKARAGRL